MIGAGAARAAWRVLAVAQLREQPTRVVATIAAIALGVALGVAVYLVNAAALNEFGHATRQLLGDADVVIRGSPEGFDEALFVAWARDDAVRAASPVLELELALPGSPNALKVLGLDPFRAAALQPALMAEIGGEVTRLFERDAIVLSAAAAAQLHVQRGDALPVVVGGAVKSLRVIDVMSGNVYPEPLGLMDIASAQWTLGHLGRLNRVDLRVRSGVDTQAFRAHLSTALPPGVVALAPDVERGRAARATRAYRVNLNMLALVALLTGAFLVLSTQSLSVLRRRTALALLRALGVTRGELQGALLAEGIAIGAAGALLGVIVGAATAALVLRYLGADLGNRQLAAAASVVFAAHPWPMLLFFAIGTIVTGLGAWGPAWEAAQRAPALALRSGDAEPVLSAWRVTRPGCALITAGLLLAWWPPIGGLPLPGYLAMAALLTGSVLLVPALMRGLLERVPRFNVVVLDMALAQLKGSVGQSAVSLASIIVSFSLMVAMAIMVHSFRDSFDLWLVKMLPADLQLHLGAAGNDTAALSADVQARLAALPGIARADFRRVRQLYLGAEHAPVTLIAREVATHAGDTLPLVREAAAPPPSSALPVWISESVQDQFGYRSGELISVPLDGRAVPCFIAGVWRDYAHTAGAIVMPRQAYINATGDRSATEGSLWRRPDISVAAIEAAVRAQLGRERSLELLSSAQLRERSLMIFDRAFAITYALEAIAVLIGLLGVSVAAGAAALARRAQFGMLRHIGMLRRQVLGMLASEGLLMSSLAALYGLALGAVLSLILVYVINRQSFNWSIDLAVPWRQLAALSAILIGAAALTALWSARAAMSADAIRAVREDW